jgi:hypothetical protein
MKLVFIFLLALLLSRSLALSATLDQFWPWLSPNSLALGTSFDDFKKIRPAAINLSELDISGRGVKPKEPYEGGLLERLPDGSIFGYSFFDDKLVAGNWGKSASPETAKLLLTVRNSLLQTCGEPTFGTTGRIKSQGGVARIVWEQYRPKMDQNYKITLKANSQSGIEVDLINVAVASQRGIKTVPPTYEEVLQSLPLSLQTSDSTGVLVDLLDDARAGKLPVAPESRPPPSELDESPDPTLQPEGPKEAPEPKPAAMPPSDEATPSTPWSIVVVMIAAALGLIWLLLKRRS